MAFSAVKDGGRLSPAVSIWGRLEAAEGARLTVAGLEGLAQIGDRLAVETGAGEARAEVVAVGRARIVGLLMDEAAGIAAGARVRLARAEEPRPSDGWLGEVLDAFAKRPDGTAAPEGARAARLEGRVPSGAERRGLGPRVATGLAALDTVLPLARGQRLGVFAGSGVGKSMLMASLATRVAADRVVIGLIGERGREVGAFVRDALGPEAMARAVVIAATSEATALEKRRAAHLTLAVAEAFRDEGAHVLCLFDSLTRYAEAHREIALAGGEAPALRAFPPSTAGALARLCERAGPGAGPQGDITAIFTVLVAGSDMEEPVADMVRGILDGHVVLDRAIAERGRFPAIDLRRSVSRSAPAAWTAEEAALAGRARAIVAAYEDALPMIQTGLYAPGADAGLDEAVRLWPGVDAFLAETAAPGEAFPRLAALLGASVSEKA